MLLSCIWPPVPIGVVPASTRHKLGASNLFDYRQVVDEDTPLFFDAGGNYDVGYIYGPLRGREAYVGLKGTF